MKKHFLFFILFLAVQTGFAQRKFNENLAITRPQYEYKKPALKPIVVLFVEKDLAPKRSITYKLNRLLDNGIGIPVSKTVSGYKIMVFSDRDRKKADEAKRKAAQVFKDEEVKLVYEQPYYRIKVGAYLNKQDADEAKKKARVHFIEAIVVPDQIRIFQRFEEE